MGEECFAQQLATRFLFLLKHHSCFDIITQFDVNEICIKTLQPDSSL